MVAIVTGALLAGAANSPAQSGTPLLTVRVTGDGKVTSAPRGIDCPPVCTAPYPPSGRPAADGAVDRDARARPAAGELGRRVLGDRHLHGGDERGEGGLGAFRARAAATPADSAGHATADGGGHRGRQRGRHGDRLPGDLRRTFTHPARSPRSRPRRCPLRLAGWRAPARRRGVRAADAGPTFVTAAFTPAAARPLGTAGADSDRDGVLDAGSACPGTERGEVAPTAVAPSTRVPRRRGARAAARDDRLHAVGCEESRVWVAPARSWRAGCGASSRAPLTPRPAMSAREHAACAAACAP